jgi:hypothetical protein
MGSVGGAVQSSQYGFGGKVIEKTGEMSYSCSGDLCNALPGASIFSIGGPFFAGGFEGLASDGV